ncbi:Pectin lyase superfamily protein [Trifolium repens]|nr:Pectin lyase superfamily protein [Trifolium repens]
MGLAQCYLIGGVLEKKKRLLDDQNCVLMDLIQYTLSPRQNIKGLLPRQNIKGLLPDAIACNSLSRRVVQPEKLIYSFRWLLWMSGDYGSQLGKQCDPYVLLIFKYFNYKDLVDEGETMAAKFNVLDDFWKAALVERYVEYGSVFWACENFYQFNRKSVGFAFYCEITGWCERYEVCVSTFENLANR